MEVGEPEGHETAGDELLPIEEGMMGEEEPGDVHLHLIACIHEYILIEPANFSGGMRAGN